MMMKAMVMEEVHDIVKGSCNVESCGSNMICVWLKGTQVDLGRTKMTEDTNKTADGVVLLI